MTVEDEPTGEPDDPWVGQTLASYTILRRLGQGGMGVVYLAQHQSLDRQAAVKFLPGELATNEAYVEMFLREANAAAKLNHTNIVSVYDAGHLGEDVYYFIMEYVEGHDLRFLIETGGKLPVHDAVQYVRQAAVALSYAHHKKIIHRDIKPENLLLTSERLIKVADLGLAKWVGTESSMMTQSGETIGSPLFMSPERLRDPQSVDVRSDIYALGGTFYQMITGEAPYQGTSAVIMSQHLLGPVPDPQKANPDLDDTISGIVKKMMTKDPTDRYQTMDEVVAALTGYEASQASATSGEKAMPPTRAGARFRPAIVVGLVCAALAAGSVGFWLLSGKSKTKSAPEAVTQPEQPANPPPVKPSVPEPTKVGKNLMLFDFAEGDGGWRVDWGDSDAGPKHGTEQSRDGRGSIAFTHHFQRGQEQLACVVELPNPKDFAGYQELVAWVLLPPGRDWELQFYVRSGADLNVAWGPIQKGLKDGWHVVGIPTESVKDITRVREIGVQVKRFNVDAPATIYIDSVEAIAQ